MVYVALLVAFHFTRYKFTIQMSEKTLNECGTYSVVVVEPSSGSSSFGVPPYYMIAWKPNGIQH